MGRQRYQSVKCFDNNNIWGAQRYQKNNVMFSSVSPREDDSEKIIMPSWEMSESLREHVNQLKRELNLEDDDMEGGVACPGEPRMDPSRTIDPNQGDSEWVDDW